MHEELLGGISESDNAASSDRCSHSVVRLYVCMSVTLVHRAKAVRRNEMPFGRDTCVVPSNIVLDRSLGPPREVEIWGIGLRIGTRSQNLHCKLRPNYYR